MKSTKLTFFQLFIFYAVSIAQIPYPNEFYDDHLPEPNILRKSVMTSSGYYSPYGKTFTPTGDLKILIICAGLGTPYDNYEVPNWPTGSNTFPNWVSNNETFYTDNSQFSNPLTLNDKYNVSRMYYEMSQGKFRLTANVYPTRIDVDPTGSSSFAQLNKKVIEKMKSMEPNFDWSPYDNRTNNPNYQFDNSISNADMVVDYVVIAYRHHREVSDQNSPWYYNPSHMINWSGAGGAYAALNGLSGISYNGYTFNYYSGYTQGIGYSNGYGIFIHELAHMLYDCPHYANANGVSADFFYTQYGHGSMNLGNIYNCSNAWERWYLGWIDLTSNGIPSDIKSASDLPVNGTFVLRDFITTGDVVRIKIPNGGNEQYLWLENHQKKSIYDERGWSNHNGCSSDVFSPSSKGLIMFNESIVGDRNITKGFWYHIGNGIKILNPNGNFDYTHSGNPETSCLLWGNQIINTIEGKQNPIAGQCRTEGIRADYDNSGTIYFNSDRNNPKPRNEAHWVAKRDGEMTYDFLGSSINFKVGKKIGLTSNPPLINRPSYKPGTYQNEPYFLNGIAVTVLSEDANGDITVKVEYNDILIDKDLRWCGDIVLPNISNNTTEDLILSNDVTLEIDKSGSANRHTKHPYSNDFINPTKFTVDENAKFVLNENSKVLVRNNSAFIVENGSTLEINGAEVIIEEGSTLIIKAGANIDILDNGNITIESGAYICIEQGANIILQDKASSIYLLPHYIVGENTNYINTSGACIANPEQFSHSGNGEISTFFHQDVYVQNEIINSSQDITGRNIYIGESVTTAKTSGLVEINSNSDVTLVANEITFDKGFELKLGSSFEVKNVEVDLESTMDNAIDLGSLSSGYNERYFVNNDGYGNNYTGPENQASPDVFYKFTLPSPMSALIKLCNSAISDAYIHILDGSGNHIQSMDDDWNYDYCDNELMPYIERSLEAGTYYIVVEGYYDKTGEIIIDFEIF